MDVLSLTAHSDGGRTSEENGCTVVYKKKKSILGTGTLRQQKSIEANMELTKVCTGLDAEYVSGDWCEQKIKEPSLHTLFCTTTPMIIAQCMRQRDRRNDQ